MLASRVDCQRSHLVAAPAERRHGRLAHQHARSAQVVSKDVTSSGAKDKVLAPSTAHGESVHGLSAGSNHRPRRPLRAEVPETDGPVLAARDQRVTLAREAVHTATVAAERRRLRQLSHGIDGMGAGAAGRWRRRYTRGRHTGSGLQPRMEAQSHRTHGPRPHSTPSPRLTNRTARAFGTIAPATRRRAAPSRWSRPPARARPTPTAPPAASRLATRPCSPPTASPGAALVASARGRCCGQSAGPWAPRAGAPPGT
mmetsp:Transcript_46469/g.149790  ORF Transcript_46469/g.149790 Transcript_46469/m.149790 type:complete len:256 (-) Transcript_46469:712-1479(-)